MIIKGLFLAVISQSVSGHVEVLDESENFPQQQHSIPDFVYPNWQPRQSFYDAWYFGKPIEDVRPQTYPYPLIHSHWYLANNFPIDTYMPSDIQREVFPIYNPKTYHTPVDLTLGWNSGPELQGRSIDYRPCGDYDVGYGGDCGSEFDFGWNGDPELQGKSIDYGPCGDYDVGYAGDCGPEPELVPVCNLEVCKESCQKFNGIPSEGVCYENECYCRKLVDEVELPEEPEDQVEQEIIQDWTYKNQEDWAKKYPNCGGQFQSPIRIKEEHKRDLSKKISWNYSMPVKLLMENNGYFVRLYIQSSEEPSLTLNGVQDEKDWSGTYNLAFMDMHWATSEHTINDQKLNMEVQLHHYNSWFDTYEEALEHEGGTLAVAIIMKESTTGGSLSNEILSNLQFIIKPNNVGYISAEDYYLKDVPRALDVNFGVYLGSQTHPPCTVGVRWLVARKPFKVTRSDVAQFQALEDVKGTAILQNVRHLQ